MQNDNPNAPGTARRQFLRAISLLGLGAVSVGALLSPAAVAASKAKAKKAKKAKKVSKPRASSPQPVTTSFTAPRSDELAGLGSGIEKTLSFEAPQTGERLVQVPFWVNGQYEPDAIREISFLLRDWRTGEVKPIDPRLLDLLFALQRKLDTKANFQVISGYRSAGTNAMLRGKSRRVARNSLHMEGKAVDIRLPGTDARRIQQAAIDLARGGVGYYPRRGFVHVDTGAIRRWLG
jgi:uncharacterized protein YcbK (DUF882 family)